MKSDKLMAALLLPLTPYDVERTQRLAFMVGALLVIKNAPSSSTIDKRQHRPRAIQIMLLFLQVYL